MTSHYKELTQQISSNLGPLREGVPQVMKSFGELGKAALAPGAVDVKTKELIALAIGVATRCDACIGFHAKALVRLGASAAEVHETLGVAVFSLEQGGESAAASAVGVLTVGITVGLMLLASWLGRRLPAGVLPWRA